MLQKLFVLCIALSFSVGAYAQELTKSTENKAKPTIDYKQEGAPLPPFIFVAYQDSMALANNTTHKKKRHNRKRKNSTDTSQKSSFKPVTAADLDNGANLLVMMFNPTCSHCEDVTFMLEKNIDVFKKSKIVLLANKVMMPYLPDFTERHHIGKYPAMHIGYDSSGIIGNLFLYQTLPQINIYNPERKLIKTYTGEVPMDTLKQFIQ